MTPPLPLPVRLAAGLVATAVEQARDLPRLALELPVTAVSQALQASMRLQQKVTELAIKGDQLLGAGPPIEDEPAWATFDEDLPPRRNGRSAGVPESSAPGSSATVTTLRRAPDPFDDPGPVDPGSVDPDGVGPESAPDLALVERALAGDVPATGTAGIDTEAADAPEILPGYANLTIPQLRGKLRHLSVDELRALLAWEHTHGDRPPFVTMLSNRIATISEE
jgi:hypothetical protein